MYYVQGRSSKCIDCPTDALIDIIVAVIVPENVSVTVVPGEYHVSRVYSLSLSHSFSREFDDNTAYGSISGVATPGSLPLFPSRFVPRHAVLEHLPEFSATQRREILVCLRTCE